MQRASRSLKQDPLDEELRLEEELLADNARCSLLAFTLFVMPHYQINWHHQKIAGAVDLLLADEYDTLMVFVPPQNGKSLLCSVMLPAFYLGLFPNNPILAATYSADLASVMSLDVQRVMTNPSYRYLFPGTRIKQSGIKHTDKDDQTRRTQREFSVIGKTGRYYGAGVGGSQTGRPCMLGLIDDPVKNMEEAMSATVQRRNYGWYQSSFLSRMQAKSKKLIIQTRWNEKDLSGMILDTAKTSDSGQRVRVLSLPAINESGKTQDDPREKGEALWPERFPLKFLEGVKTEVGSKVWVSLYQQRPAPEGGGTFKRHWWKIWKVRPEHFDFIAISCDLTFKDSEKGDWTVMQVWAKLAADFYLLDQVRDRMAFTAQKAAIRALLSKHTPINAVWVEDAANGAALVDDLKGSITGLIAVPAKGSKIARAEAVAPKVEAGNVYLPDPEVHEWVQGFIDEHSVFPYGAHDDQVDAASQALNKMPKVASFQFKPLSLKGTSRWG